MSSPLAIPAELVQDAIAHVDASGQLHPVTLAMHGWVENVASCIADLPLSKDQLSDLESGAVVRLDLSGVCWQLQQNLVADVVWLVVRDVTAIDRLEASRLATARSRSLAAMAGSLTHDLNNQINLVLALTAQLDALITSPDDRQSVQDLESATQAGARLLSVLAHLLIRGERSSELLQPGELLADAVLLVEKSMVQGGVDLSVDYPQGLPSIRGSHVEIVQGVMEGFVALLGSGAKAIKCTMDRETIDVAGGRLRECVVLRCKAAPVDSVAVLSLRRIVDGQEGMLAEICGQSDVLPGLANAVFVQKRMGGDLIMSAEGRDVCLRFSWPAVVQSSR